MIACDPLVAISSPVDFVLSYQTCSAYQEVICTNSVLTELSVTYWNNKKKMLEQKHRGSCMYHLHFLYTCAHSALVFRKIRTVNSGYIR
jgi:hypothetical protein